MKRLGTTAMALAIMATGTATQAANLTLAHHNAVDSQITNRGEAFKACVEGAGVDMTIQHLPAAQLGTAREVMEQVMIGAVDMSITDTAYLSEIEPPLAAFQLPFIFADWQHAERAMEGAPGEMIRTTLAERHNLAALAFMHNGFRDLLTVSVPVRSIEDMPQVQFRSPPLPAWLAMFDALGVQPVSVPWNEVYTAMQTGLVGGMEAPPDGFVNSKAYEVGKYVTRTGHMYNLTVLVASSAALDRLNEAQRASIEDCAATFQAEGNVEVIELTDVSLDQMRAAGLEVIEVDKTPFRERLQAAWPAIAGEGPEVAAFIDAIAAAQ